ncbi:MAG: hypothetical protein ACRC67_07200 [Inquilinus sp.]|uniref:hypothetical protein n=1 Tax=Inquilinus sp. TaxID=1932117 RepID=UPI003F400249
MATTTSKPGIGILLGRGVHEMNPDGSTSAQGIIRGAPDGKHVLVEWKAWASDDALDERLIALSELSETHRSGKPRFRLFPSFAAAKTYMAKYGAAADAQIRGRTANTQIHPLRAAPPPQPAPVPDLMDDLM